MGIDPAIVLPEARGKLGYDGKMDFIAGNFAGVNRGHFIYHHRYENLGTDVPAAAVARVNASSQVGCPVDF